MSIRTYADNAVAQGKLAAEQANQFVGSLADRATGAVGELRAHAERALPIDTIKSVVEPYVARTREQLQKHVQTVTSDPRAAKAIATAETVAGVVTDTVTEHIVKPVVSRTGLGKPASKPVVTETRKPAATRPATKPAATTASTKPAAKKASSKPAAKKAGSTGAAPSKRTTRSTSTSTNTPTS